MRSEEIFENLANLGKFVAEENIKMWEQLIALVDALPIPDDVTEEEFRNDLKYRLERSLLNAYQDYIKTRNRGIHRFE